uniref:Uncharacterized protein n=1 Tax=viral metagenome TaxID=1070528 RepID=A0A6C0LDB6_9ZZZZ
MTHKIILFSTIILYLTNLDQLNFYVNSNVSTTSDYIGIELIELN